MFFTPPPPAELPARMAALCEFANATSEGAAFIHPILRSILLHFWLAYDHSFPDAEADDNDATYFVLNQLELLQKSVDHLREHVAVKRRELADRVNLLTARRDLVELAGLDLLLPDPKQGRALTYIAPADLAARLEAAGR